MDGEESYQRLTSKQTTSIINIDLNHKFSKIFSLDAGYKNTFNNYNFLFETQNDQNNSNKDVRNLLYTYLNFTPEGKLKSKLGLAVENDRLKTNEQTNINYSFQPYFSMHYSFNNDLNISLNLKSNSHYPNADQLNPHPITIDRYSRYSGNPNLNFSTKYTGSLTFSLLKNQLTIEPFYDYTKNHISKTGNTMFDYYSYSYSNMDRYESFGVQMGLRLPLIAKKLIFNITASLYNEKIKFNNKTSDINDYTVNSNLVYLSSQYKTLYALTLKKMNAKQIQAYGYYENDNDYLGVIVKQPFFKKKLDVTLLYLLPMDFGLDHEIRSYYSHDHYRELSTTNTNVLKNLLMIKVSVNLNKGKALKRIEKNDYKECDGAEGFL